MNFKKEEQLIVDQQISKIISSHRQSILDEMHETLESKQNKLEVMAQSIKK